MMLAETLEDFALKHTDLLVKRAARGDEQAFSKLMGLWYKRIYNFNFKYFLDHDLAMETTQQTFISVHGGLPKLKESASFRSWLYRIALNKCHEEDRKNKRRSWFSLFMGSEDEDKKRPVIDAPAEGVFFNPDQKLDARERGELILSCLSQIPEEQKVVVIMKEYEGLKFREIAESLNISENTAKSRLYYGLKALRGVFDKNNIHKDIIYDEK